MTRLAPVALLLFASAAAAVATAAPTPPTGLSNGGECGGAWTNAAVCRFPCSPDGLLGVFGSVHGVGFVEVHVFAACGLTVADHFVDTGPSARCHGGGDGRGGCFDFEGNGAGLAPAVLEGTCVVIGLGSGEFHCFSEGPLLGYDATASDRDGDGLPEAHLDQGSGVACVPESPSFGADGHAAAFGQRADASARLACGGLAPSSSVDADPGEPDPDELPPGVGVEPDTNLGSLGDLLDDALGGGSFFARPAATTT